MQSERGRRKKEQQATVNTTWAVAIKDQSKIDSATKWRWRVIVQTCVCACVAPTTPGNTDLNNGVKTQEEMKRGEETGRERDTVRREDGRPALPDNKSGNVVYYNLTVDLQY